MFRTIIHLFLLCFFGLSLTAFSSVSNMEPNPIHRKRFLDLACMAKKQAAIWENQLKIAQLTVPAHYSPDLRVRIILTLVHYLGAKSLRIALAAMKIRGVQLYLE